MSDGSAKQQIVDKVKNSTNILVTVSNDPSVDELSAALGLTLLLNKMKKHATAVFSGAIPPAITFLDPEKTFENTVDSLRDFIIALDKEKADHLRYKVEGDVVKIFITPYRTTITSDDLDFSQGDYNVELVLALGVRNQDSLDAALEAHGRILHDATVATVMAGGDKSELGSIGWRDESASSLSEMMVSLSEALKGDASLLDEQIATAFLAGIVAATERFSNNRTSARVMTMSAQLMGAGANQQLIASKFEEADEEGVVDEPRSLDSDNDTPDDTEAPANNDGTTDLSEGESTKVERAEPSEEENAPQVAQPEAVEKPADGTLNVPHEKEGTVDEVAEQTASEQQADAAEAAEAELARQAQEVAAEQQADAVAAAEQELSDQLPQVVQPAAADLSAADLQKDITAAAAAVDDAVPKAELKGAVSSEVWKDGEEPALGGTLNATTEAAEEESRKADADNRNKTILNHGTGYIADSLPSFSSPLNAANKPPEEEPIINPLQGEDKGNTAVAPVQPPTLSDLDDQNRAPAELPPLPDFSTLPPLPPAIDTVGGESVVPDTLGDILPPTPNTPPAQSGPADPSQFKIPGQS